MVRSLQIIRPTGVNTPALAWTNQLFFSRASRSLLLALSWLLLPVSVQVSGRDLRPRLLPGLYYLASGTRHCRAWACGSRVVRMDGHKG